MLSQASRSQPGCAQVRRKLSNQAAIQLLRKSSARELRQWTLQAIIHHEVHARPLPAYSRRQAVCDLALGARARATIVSRAFDHAGKCRIVAFDNGRANEGRCNRPELYSKAALNRAAVLFAYLGAGKAAGDKRNVPERRPDT